GQGSPLDGAEAHEEQDQEAVDKRDGGLEEVVVVFGDELAEFVDEQPEAGSANQRRQPLAPFADHGQQEHERNEHEQSAPEHVGDVKSASTHARKAGHTEKQARQQNGHDRGNQQV